MGGYTDEEKREMRQCMSKPLCGIDAKKREETLNVLLDETNIKEQIEKKLKAASLSGPLTPANRTKFKEVTRDLAVELATCIDPKADLELVKKSVNSIDFEF